MASDEEINKLTKKIVVVGDGICGKTCMLMMYANNKFPHEYIPTVFDNYIKTLEAEDGNTLHLLLMDTSGQEEYERLRRLQYEDTHVFLLCFSVDNLPSYQNIKYKWINELKSYNVPIILVGTKIDLRKSSGVKLITKEEGCKMAKRIKAIQYLECSALNNEGIEEVFKSAATLSINDMQHYSSSKCSFCCCFNCFSCK